MKIIQNNKEYGYQQPIINNIDVLLDVTNRTSGIADGNYNLNTLITSYERIIISVWVNTQSISDTSYLLTQELSVADIVANYGSTKAMFPLWGGEDSWIYVLFNSDYKSVKLVKYTSGAYVGRLKVEGVKRTAQVSNLDTWEDITSKCTFAGGLSSSNTKVYANPLFIYIGHYGNCSAADNSLIITLPSGYEAFGCLGGNQFRQQWTGAGIMTSTSSSSMSFGKGRYLWMGAPGGGSATGIFGGVLLRNV